MNKALADLILISRTTGRDPRLVAGGGGNTSVKTADGKYMLIKASGTALKDMSADLGWRRQRLDKVLEIVSDDSLADLDDTAREQEVVDRLLRACDDNITTGARPSVESHLHAMLDRVVIHLHPHVIGAYVNAKNGKDQISQLFKDEKYPPLWVPYTDPGFLLARKLRKLLQGYEKQYGRQPHIMILDKHGIFVTADTPQAAFRHLRKALRTCELGLKKLPSRRLKDPDPDDILAARLAVRRAVFAATGLYRPVAYHRDERIESFITRPDAAKLVSTPALTPDELVYAQGSPLWLDSIDPERIARAITKRTERSGKTPTVFVAKGLGVFVAADRKAMATIGDIARGSLFIRMHAANFGGVRALTPREQEFINNWESESFRKKIAASAGVGDLQDRIAVVTGGGSGLGRSIAVGLARAGAMVAIADLDVKAGQETAEIIMKERPQASAVVVECNVTDEAIVGEAFAGLLEQWGGVDVLVNAAGVAPAYPLVDTDVNKWRLALEVNLTGYLLMAKAAAAVMIRQGMGGSIVNISSKSGIDASKNNSAYNATKAGELHLTRGWAMELGEHGIRVNSVCPGNVFEGSKIWNPQYIRECARKYGIKPEEVIPYYVNRTILKREIKGQDIADAVVFLASDKARCITAQTLVADSGQAVVR